MATIGIVMRNMLSIYVATAGFVMSNMLSNCVKVYTSIDNLYYSVLQIKLHYSFLPDYVCKNQFHLAWTSCLFCFLHISWLLLTPIVVDLIR